jgi:uncharacterized protein YqcC (DUF446 family)
MNEHSNAIVSLAADLENAMRAEDLWLNQLPGWVQGFQTGNAVLQTDFAQWLQFVFIPNHLHSNRQVPQAEKNLIVPQAMKFFGNDVRKGKLLRILIEIDALL